MVELFGTTFAQGCRVFEKQLQSIAVSKYGVAARLPLDRQVLLEEILDQGGEPAL